MNDKRTVEEIIKELEEKYADDEEAVGVIEEAKEDIEYIREKEKEGGYDGQPSMGRALELVGHLETWYPVMCKRIVALADGRGSGKLY